MVAAFQFVNIFKCSGKCQIILSNNKVSPGYSFQRKWISFLSAHSVTSVDSTQLILCFLFFFLLLCSRSAVTSINSAFCSHTVFICLFVCCYDSQSSDYSLNGIDCCENCKAKQYFYTLLQKLMSLEWPRGFQEVKVPRFHDNGTGWW